MSQLKLIYKPLVLQIFLINKIIEQVQWLVAYNIYLLLLYHKFISNLGKVFQFIHEFVFLSQLDHGDTMALQKLTLAIKLLWPVRV